MLPGNMFALLITDDFYCSFFFMWVSYSYLYLIAMAAVSKLIYITKA